MWACLPSCSLLSRRGIQIEAVCPLCRQDEETLDHAIFCCPILCRIWTTVDYDCSLDESGSSCSPFLHALRTTTRQRSALWAITAYQIWLARNQLIFTDESTSPHRLLQKVRSMMAETASLLIDVDSSNLGLWSSPAVSAANRRTVYISWELPPPGFVKINFDGSVRGRMAGSAFIIRGTDGALLAAGGFGSLDSSVPMAELYAAWAGISHAVRQLHVHCLIVEGDSLTVIRWLRLGCCDQFSVNPILGDIQTALRGLLSVYIRHIYREANTAADWIASAVAQHGGSWSWNQGDHCPSALTQILYSDCSGLTRTRVV